MIIIPPTTTLSRLHAALQHGSVPDDLMTPLHDLLHQLDFAIGAVDRAAEHFPDDVVQQSAYREGTLDLVLDGYARLRSVAPLAGSGG